MRRVVSIVVIVVVVIAAIGAGYWVYSSRSTSKLTLASSQPSMQQTGVAPDSALVFNYTQDLDPNQNTSNIKVSPLFGFAVEIKGKQLKLIPREALVENTQYLVTLTNIKSTVGQSLTSTLSFTAGANQSARARFLRTLPRSTSQYSITYNNTTNSFTVIILSLPEETSKEAALNYFKNQGIDPLKESIQFQTARTLNGQGAPPG